MAEAIWCGVALFVLRCIPDTIHFFKFKNIASNKIHRCLTATYDSEVTSIQAARKWCHQLQKWLVYSSCIERQLSN